MDETKINELISKLPQDIKDLVYDGAWEQRTRDVANKYSLSPDKIELLVDSVFFVIIGADKIEDLPKSMKVELALSDIVTEQVMEDLLKRVFENAIKFLQSKKNKPKSSTPSTIPEIRPETVPMVERTENKVGVPRYIPTENKPESNIGTSKINYNKTEAGETVQKVAEVPRFNMAKEEVVSSTTQNKQTNIIDEKLNSVTSGITEELVQKTTPIVKSYSVDPYREPLE